MELLTLKEVSLELENQGVQHILFGSYQDCGVEIVEAFPVIRGFGCRILVCQVESSQISCILGRFGEIEQRGADVFQLKILTAKIELETTIGINQKDVIEIFWVLCASEIVFKEATNRRETMNRFAESRREYAKQEIKLIPLDYDTDPLGN